MRAIPSPTARTQPPPARSASTSYCPIRERRIDVISSGRSFTVVSAPHQFSSQSFKSSTHTRVRAIRAGLQHEAAQESRIDAARRFNLSSRRLLDLADDLAGLGVRQLARGDELDRQAPLLARHQPLELCRDVLDLGAAAFLCDELQEVAEENVFVAREIREDGPLRRELELRVPQNRAQLGRVRDRAREVRQRLVHGRQPARVLGGLKERLGIDAVRDCYSEPSRREKSSEPIASLINSRSRSASSF